MCFVWYDTISNETMHYMHNITSSEMIIETFSCFEKNGFEKYLLLSDLVSRM